MNKNLPNEPQTNNRFRIHPGLGIARVGNSPNEFFIGPEAPNWNPAPPDSLYKDSNGLIKKQAARFRVYEYDEQGNPLREIDSRTCRIVWTVTIANKKGGWYQFIGEQEWKDPSKRKLRNPTIESTLSPDQRSSLNITPSAKSIEGINAKPQLFNDGYFLNQQICLGEIRTDDAGRLLILGGDGHSASVHPNNPVTDFVNNDGWYDTTADGWVEATIHLPDQSPCRAERASVIIAPPSFAPELQSLVTLDDQMQEIAQGCGWVIPESNEVRFYRDIYPLLVRTSNLAWVSGAAFHGHGAGAYGSFADQKHVAIYSDNSSATQERRQKLFSILRSPDTNSENGGPSTPESRGLMPLLYGSLGVDENEKPRNWFSVLPTQYARMKAWAEGNFVLDTPQKPCPLESYPIPKQPAMLDRAALQYCAGGPFFPGIEITFIATHADTWNSPYRINSQWQPGDITKWMAVPWQSDFYECTIHWWPIQRPDSVLTRDDFLKKSFGKHSNWTRGLHEQSPQGNNEMVKYWSNLGFVRSIEADTADIYVEQERNPNSWPHDF